MPGTWKLSPLTAAHAAPLAEAVRCVGVCVRARAGFILERINCACPSQVRETYVGSYEGK